MPRKPKNQDIPIPPANDLDAFTPDVEESDLSLDDPVDLDDEPLEATRPALTGELSEDPVRLYLREIGQVKLLDSDSEFRLSTMIEAHRFVERLERHVPRKGIGRATQIYRSTIDDLVIAWKRFSEDAKRLAVQLPDLSLVLAEAQALRQGWHSDSPLIYALFWTTANGAAMSSGTIWPRMLLIFSSVFICCRQTWPPGSCSIAVSATHARPRAVCTSTCRKKKSCCSI